MPAGMNILQRPALHFFILLFLSSCGDLFDAPVPPTAWAAFDTAHHLPHRMQPALEGVYAVGKGGDAFGPRAVSHWSYTVNGADTTYHLSFFCEDEASYFICELRQTGSRLLANGYWRKLVNTETGRVRLEMPLQDWKDTSARGKTIVWKGHWGKEEDVPDRPLELRFLKPLFRDRPLEVVAHRGGGRNNDLLPASENSVEILKLAAAYGATGVEIDVKLTKDGIPVLYHDAQVNDRITTRAGIHGPVSDFTWAALQAFELKRGGRIPLLEAALDTILYKTPLRFVWLDCKYEGSLQPVVALQQRYLQKAAAAGRQLQIVIGLPDEKPYARFKALTQHHKIPSLCELDTAMTSAIDADIWAPSWTEGLQNEAVGHMHAQGRRVFVWTMDAHDKIEEYLRDGRFDGIVSNRPSMVAFYYYVQ